METRADEPLATPTGRRPRPGRRRFLFIAVILVVLFAAQEILFRSLFPLPEVLFNRADYLAGPIFSEEISLKRGKALCNVITRWEFEPDGLAFDHTLNLYGFRGPDFAIEPPTDRPRILFVGDSFVEGCGAADQDTLPRQFAKQLGDRPPEVLNLGALAANFPEYLRLLRDAVPLLRPHTVFLVVCSNDLPAPAFDKPTSPRTFARLSPYRPRALQALTLLGQGWVLPRRSHSGPFPCFAAVPSPTNPFSTHPAVEGLDPALEEAMWEGKANPHLAATLPIFEQNLRRDYDSGGGAEQYLSFLSRFCRDHGVRLHVVYVPFHVAANPTYLAAQVKLGGCARVKLPASFSDAAHRTQQRHLARACRDADLSFLDTTDAFIAGEREQRLFWPTDGHCNAAGYRLLAESCVQPWAK